LASPIGTANITNCLPAGGVSFSATKINWLQRAGMNLGCILTTVPTSISYSGGTFRSGTGFLSSSSAGMIDLLLKSGARRDARTKDGLMPLELARKYNHTHLVPTLTPNR
jgi:hypothetical protein